MSAVNNTVAVPDVSSEQTKRTKQEKALKILYPSLDFGGGVWKAYFSTYLPMLYTDIYLLPVALSGMMEMVQSFLAWLAAPLWGAIVDRVTTKKGKYWMWILLASCLSTVFYVILFALPSLSANPSGMAFFVFIIAALLAVSLAITDNTGVALYPRLASSAKDRTFLSVGRSVGREGSKTIFGFLTPIMLISFTAIGGSDVAGWATTAVVIGLLGLVFYVMFSFYLKNSYVEKEAIAEMGAVQTAKRAKPPMRVVLKGLVTNRPLLVMFLFFSILKFYDIGFAVSTSSYFFRYYIGDFSAMAGFMTFRTFAELIGGIVGIYWLKMMKETKRAFVSAGILHVATLGVVSLLIGRIPTAGLIALLAVNQFFIGIMSAYVLPFFAAASDFGALRSGVRTDGLNMSAYSLALRVAILLGTSVRVAILAFVGYDATLYVDGVMPSAEVLGQLANFQSVYPLILSVIGVSLVAFLFPINDAKLKEIKEELLAKGL